MATTQRMTSDQIAQMFANRLSPTGGWISAKQAAWLYNTWRDEVYRSCPDARLSSIHKVAQVRVNGQPWIMAIQYNGAGILRPQFC